MPRRVALAACLALISTAAARAENAAPLVHPIFAHLPDAPEDDRARQDFTTAAGHYNLRPVEIVDVPAPPAPHGPDEARLGILNAQKMAFTEAKKDLDAAASEAASTGGAGFSTADLVDLYLHRAMATARADWKAQAAAPATDERTRAFDDYLRAATLMPITRRTPASCPRRRWPICSARWTSSTSARAARFSSRARPTR